MITSISNNSTLKNKPQNFGQIKYGSVSEHALWTKESAIGLKNHQIDSLKEIADKLFKTSNPKDSVKSFLNNLVSNQEKQNLNTFADIHIFVPEKNTDYLQFEIVDHTKKNAGANSLKIPIDDLASIQRGLDKYTTKADTIKQSADEQASFIDGLASNVRNIWHQ